MRSGLDRKVFRQGDDALPAEGAKNEQIAIAGDDEVGIRPHRTFEDHIVVGIAA